MNLMPDLTIGSEVLGLELYSKSFDEFCETLDELMKLSDDELYIEAVDDPRVKSGKGAKKIVRRTIETTKDVAGAYGDITDANGNLLKATWDLVMKTVKLCIKAISWILNKISLIPKFILSVMNKIGRVPDSVRAKVRGDIRLYITVDDIGMLYNKGLLVYLEQFFSQLGLLTKGDMWGTVFRRRGNKGSTHSPLMGKNDVKIINTMTGIYHNISRISFTPTLIKMNDQRTIDMYFGTGKNISYKDLKGREYSCNYLEALNQLIAVVQSKQEILKSLQQDLTTKFDRTRENQEFGELHPSDQKRIMDAMRMVSNVITTMGNISRYVMEDVKTINTATETLIKKGKLQRQEDQKEDQGNKK